jgi:hypothetical protein
MSNPGREIKGAQAVTRRRNSLTSSILPEKAQDECLQTVFFFPPGPPAAGEWNAISQDGECRPAQENPAVPLPA